jgi:hypothetical protein
MRGDGVEGSCWVSANEYICAQHVTWSPNKLWISTSIFNLWCHRTVLMPYVYVANSNNVVWGLGWRHVLLVLLLSS